MSRAKTGFYFSGSRSNYRSITGLRMSDMRLPPLLQSSRRAHSVRTLSFRVARMSPSSSGAGVRLSLLEGDCVGPTRPILKAGLLGARLFFCSDAASFPARGFQCSRLSYGFHNEKDRRPLTAEPAHRIISLMITNPCAFAAMKKASLSGASDRRAQ